MDLLSWEHYLISNGLKIGTSFLLAGVGLYLAKRIRNKLVHIFSNSTKNQAIKLFLTNGAYALILIISGIMVLGKLGIPTATLITIIGTSSLAVGLALKDFLANIAAGIMLVFQRPFDIGDLVECQGTFGKVHSIELFNTHIKTPNNEIVIIPNGKLIKEKITNKAFGGMRRLELNISISYDSPLGKAKIIAHDLIKKDPRALLSPSPIVGVNNLGDNGVELTIKVWTHRNDYNGLKYSLLENIKIEFDKQNIIIPFNQLDVFLKNSISTNQEQTYQDQKANN